tara:strand:+ start:1305 stop:1529 length:225 start_codon:yes stop_codon:yes gene_type:complete
MKTMRKLSEEMIETLIDQQKKVGTNEALNEISLLLEVAKEIHKATCSRCGNPVNFHKETRNKLGCGCETDVMFQ